MEPNQSFSSPLQDFNDPTVGAELFKKIGISATQMSDPRIANMVRDISSYLHKQPDPMFTIRTISRSAMRSTRPPIEHFASYVMLEREMEDISGRYNKMKEDIKNIEGQYKELEAQLKYYK